MFCVDPRKHCRYKYTHARHERRTQTRLRKVEAMGNATAITAKQQAAINRFFGSVRSKFATRPDDQYSDNIVNFNFIHSYVCASAVVIFNGGRNVYVEATIGTRGGIRKVQTTHRNRNNETLRVVKGIAWK